MKEQKEMKKIEEGLFYAESAKEGFEESLKYEKLALNDFKKAHELEPSNKRYKQDYLNCLDRVKETEQKINQCDEMIKRFNSVLKDNVISH